MGSKENSKVTDGSPVSSYPETGHLFVDGARVGSVPAASPALGLHLPAPFTISQSTGGLLSRGRERARRGNVA